MYIGRGNKIREAGKKEADISVHYSDSGFGYCLYGFERLLASGHKGTIELFGHTLHGLTWAGFGWLFLELCCLGLYAILWQQIIKHFDLSVVYANRAFAVCWTMLWSVLLFGEHIKPLNIVGVLIVLVGIMLVNADAK